jgi:hypothetical protein
MAVDPATSTGESMPLVSVILPVRDPSEVALRRCLCSFAALSAVSRMELVVVRTGVLDPRWLDEARGFCCVRIVECEVPGIYAAFNTGTGAAAGKFLLFYGHDDIALPDMDAAMQLLESTDPERTLVACGVHVQGLGNRWPSRLRQGIVFRNWGHQGLFYPASMIEPEAYDAAYPLRADHRLNMKLLSRKSVACLKPPLVVSYFSRGGYSTQNIADSRFDTEQARLAACDFGWVWGVAVRVLLPVVRATRRAFRVLVP